MEKKDGSGFYEDRSRASADQKESGDKIMSAYPRPIHCAKCEVDLKPEKNGVWLIELFQNDTEPYAIWHADLWKCPICRVEIISGYGKNPTYHHEEKFSEWLEVAKQNQFYYNYERKEL